MLIRTIIQKLMSRTHTPTPAVSVVPTPEPQMVDNPFDQVIRENRLTLDQAQSRWEALLDTINSQVQDMTQGKLVPVPLCPSACAPGPMSDFLLDMQMDPFLRWNMMYYAADPETAIILQTELYNPTFEGDFDEAMIALLNILRASWNEFRIKEPDADVARVKNYRDTLRGLLCDQIAEIEDLIYDGKVNVWKNFFGEEVKRAA
jgi:hypothetical protein